MHAHRRLSRKSLVAVIAIALVAGICQSILVRTLRSEDRSTNEAFNVSIRKRQPQFLIPSEGKIAVMKAECYDQPELHIPQFDIPSKYFEPIIEHLRTMEIDPNPDIEARELGTIRIESKDGESDRVCWYQSSRGGGLSWNGIRVRLKGADENGGATVLGPIVRIIAEKSNNKGAGSSPSK